MKHSEYIKNVKNSDTVVLFIHGILGSPNQFTDFLPLVPDKWSVHNILLEGHGKTVRHFSNSSMKAWKTQVCTKINELSEQFENIVIVAHSMGALFAVENCVKASHKIKAMFLLGIPLTPTLKLPFLKRAFKIIFEQIPEHDVVTKDLLTKYSIKPNKNLWEYLGWIPRYLELFETSNEIKNLISMINIPCYVYLSRNDEFVSPKTEKYLQNNNRVTVNFLNNSTHFHYSKDDITYIHEEFENFYKSLSPDTI